MVAAATAAMVAPAVINTLSGLMGQYQKEQNEPIAREKAILLAGLAPYMDAGKMNVMAGNANQVQPNSPYTGIGKSLMAGASGAQDAMYGNALLDLAEKAQAKSATDSAAAAPDSSVFGGSGYGPAPTGFTGPSQPNIDPDSEFYKNSAPQKFLGGRVITNGRDQQGPYEVMGPYKENSSIYDYL